VPTINKYTDEEGYYIRARPSGAGNITYKIKDEGNPVVWKHGLRDDDEISWSTIQSFKALGIVYTEQSGTLEPDDFEPDPKQLEKTTLAESDARELFSIITAQFDLSQEERAEIRSILGLPPEMNLKTIGDRISSHLESSVGGNNLSTRGDQTAKSDGNVDIASWVEESDSTNHELRRLHILFITKNGGESQFTDHCIHICNKHGLERWHIRTLEPPTWEIKRVAIEQKSVIFPRLLEELQAAEFDLGDPSEVLSPVVEVNKNDSVE
jgi:hypothetical protein